MQLLVYIKGKLSMLNLSIQELFFRVIPEEFLFILAIYSFSKTTINIKKYAISSIMLSIIAYLVRLLPIQYGVHTILGIIAILVIAVNIMKIDIIQAIRASIITMIIEFICEVINIFIIQYILKKDINYIFNDPNLKIVYGIPSLIIFAFIITIYYIRAFVKKELKGVINGEDC